MSALILEKTSAFRFNTSLTDILHLRCSISGRIGLFTAISVSVGLSGKLEQLDSPSSVSDFIEKSFLKDFIPFRLFKINSLLACNGHQSISTSSSSPYSDILCSGTTESQEHTHTVRSEWVSEKLLPKIAEHLVWSIYHLCSAPLLDLSRSY